MEGYYYRVKNFFGDVISEGLLNCGIDIPIENIIPNISTSCDRNINDIQEFLDKNYNELQYTFEYKLFSLDYDKLENGSE